MIYKKVPLDENDKNVFLEVFVADKIKDYTRKAILVIPGGGYGNICSDREGEPIALAFMRYGYNAFVLHYSVSSTSKKTFPTQLIQASIAMKYIRDHSEEYGHDINKVFATGFSAGGHLCASLGILWNIPEIYASVDMPNGYNKPNGIMPVYPVINNSTTTFRNLLGKDAPTDEELKKVQLDRYVSNESSPAFIMHTSNDQIVNVSNSLDLATAYAKAGMTFELHIYPDAPHGVALGNEITRCGIEKYCDASIAKWIENAVYWADKITK